MFSGITQGLAPVLQSEATETGCALQIDLGAAAAGLVPGASVAVDGVCLTATQCQRDIARFDVIGETLRRTTLGELRASDLVSIERSLKLGDEIGGHEVSGHVTGTARVLALERSGQDVRLTLEAASEWTPCLLPQGFVAVDGSSLTVATVAPGRFEVCLIPETLRRTRLGQHAVGDRVNVELDRRTATLAATAQRFLEASLRQHDAALEGRIARAVSEAIQARLR